VTETLDENKRETSESLIVRQPLHDAATKRLREMIIENELVPGQRVPERQLCDQLGISRTPLREALKVLAAEGLVELLPNRGASVAPLTIGDLESTIEVMAPLEYMIGRLAAQRATDEQIAEIRALHFDMLACHARGQLPDYFRLNQAIHTDILMATGNTVLCNTWQSLNSRIRRYRYLVNIDAKRWGEAMQEHGEILKALEGRDQDQLGLLLQDHLINTARRMQSRVQEDHDRLGSGTTG
jgi:DNA-binding GntR family transcriptional regulator